MASEDLKQASPRRARNSLSRDLILDAALELAQSGLEISLRSVAARLACSAMALYRHFPDKQDLLLGLLDKVIGSIELGEQSQSWNVRLMRLAKEHLRVLQSHSWAIPLLFQNPDPGPAVRKVGEAMLHALKEGGASNDAAVSVFSSILALNYGWAGFTSQKSTSSDGSQLPQRLREKPDPQDNLPETLEIWPEFENLGSNIHHEAALVKLLSHLNGNG
jgi:AcrR family transcriptional regulator